MRASWLTPYWAAPTNRRWWRGWRRSSDGRRVGTAGAVEREDGGAARRASGERGVACYLSNPYFVVFVDVPQAIGGEKF